MISKYLSNKNTLNQIPQPIDREKVNFSDGDQWHLEEKNYSDTYFIEDLFADSEIDQIICIGEVIDKQRAKTQDSGENCLEQRRSFISWLKINDYTRWIYQKCSSAILDANEHFKYDLEYFESLQFTRYDWEENGFYSSHIDIMNWTMPKNRKLSFVIQLSDSKDYEGGDLILRTSKDPRIIKKKRGLVTFFPSYTLHEVTPVTKGTRYTLVGWVHGPPFK